MTTIKSPATALSKPALLLVLAGLFLNSASGAEITQSYEASYKASFKGVNATATRSLQEISDREFELRSSIKLKLLGATVSRIREKSLFSREDEQIKPAYYEYKQSGLGKRLRSVRFDWESQSAESLKNAQPSELSLSGHELDELSYFLHLRQAVSKGEQDILFPVADGDEIKDYHYRVVGEEVVDTPLGRLNSIKLARIRDQDSPRRTELWLAKDWDYLLIKMIQEEEDARYELYIDEAVIGGRQVTALSE